MTDLELTNKMEGRRMNEYVMMLSKEGSSTCEGSVIHREE